MEVWKTVEGFENYEISNLGRVKINLKYNKYRDYQHRLLNPSLDKDGYRRTTLTPFDKNKKTKRIHRLVAIAFIDNPLNKPCVNHKNGIKDDNRLSNLEWVTVSENNKHAYATGLITRTGENNALSVFTESQVLEIRALYSTTKITLKELANKYNVSLGAISGVIYRNTWKHI